MPLLSSNDDQDNDDGNGGGGGGGGGGVSACVAQIGKLLATKHFKLSMKRYSQHETKYYIPPPHTFSRIYIFVCLLVYLLASRVSHAVIINAASGSH